MIKDRSIEQIRKLTKSERDKAVENHKKITAALQEIGCQLEKYEKEKVASEQALRSERAQDLALRKRWSEYGLLCAEKIKELEEKRKALEKEGKMLSFDLEKILYKEKILREISEEKTSLKRKKEQQLYDEECSSKTYF